MRVVLNWETVFEGTEIECIAIKAAIDLLGKANSNLVLSKPSLHSNYDNPNFEIIGYCSLEAALED